MGGVLTGLATPGNKPQLCPPAAAAPGCGSFTVGDAIFLEKHIMTFYRVEKDILYVLTMFLIAGLDQTLPRTGGRFTTSDLTSRLDRLFPNALSPLARNRLVQRAIELVYVKAKGFTIPAWIGIDLVDNELTCPSHPQAPTLPDSFLLPTCHEGDQLGQAGTSIAT